METAGRQDRAIPISYVTAGHDVPDDIEVASSAVWDTGGWEQAALSLAGEFDLCTHVRVTFRFYSNFGTTEGEGAYVDYIEFNSRPEGEFYPTSGGFPPAATTPTSASATPNPACAGQQVTLSASGGSDGTLTWYAHGCGNGASIGEGSSFTISA